jgi:hypothetical protein
MGFRRNRRDGDEPGHPDFTQWTDFVRLLPLEGESRKAEAHLSSCQSCQRTVAFLRRVAAAAAGDARVTVPRDVEHSAKSLFLLHRPERIGLLQRLTTALVYSTQLEPAPAGLRSVGSLTEQALYTSGDYALDLRLDQSPSGAHVLIGQIAHRHAPGQRLGGAPVVLLAGRKVVAQTQSNRFGEFQMEYEPGGRLRLCVAVAEGRIEVPLGGRRTSAHKKRS